MAGTVIADNLQAAATSTLVIKNGVASTPPTIQDSAGTEIGTFCRAWVNFDGTGTFSPNPSTTKIRASFNVSSITDNGTGDYTVNFTNAMPDANYSVSSSSGAMDYSSPDATRNPCMISGQSAASFRYTVRSGAGTATAVDVALSSVSVFR